MAINLIEISAGVQMSDLDNIMYGGDVENAQRILKRGLVPPTADLMVISNLEQGSLALPPQVKILELFDVEAGEDNDITITSSSLEEIYISSTAFAVNFGRWTFPASLRLLSISDYGGDILNLRGVRVPTIELRTFDNRRAILPEGLDKLILNNENHTPGAYGARMTYVFPEAGDNRHHGPARVIDLPRDLRALHLVYIDDIERVDNPGTAHVKELTMEDLDEFDGIDLPQMFPALERLNLAKLHVMELPDLDLPQLEELTMTDCVVESHIEIGVPSLASLSLTDVSGPEDEPTVELGRMPYLQELITDEMVVANTHEVYDLMDYRFAWGLMKKGKNPYNQVRW